jgi:hypothetical protein
MIALLKPIQRKTVDKFMHYQAPIVVELKLGDFIRGLRLLRHKRESRLEFSMIFISMASAAK